MDPSMAPIPQRLPDEGAPLAEYPSLGSRLWVDRLRLLGMMVFFAQLTETEAPHPMSAQRLPLFFALFLLQRPRVPSL